MGKGLADPLTAFSHICSTHDSGRRKRKESMLEVKGRRLHCLLLPLLTIADAIFLTEADGRPITTIFLAIPFAATAVPSFLQPPDHRIRWL
uniref:Uncharacterized protein n=2 Tax=Oryza TaxID=4527 RepID=A0A0D3GQZ3_9ORYZ